MDALKIEYLSPSDLKPYRGNARKHEEADLSTIRASIQEFGFLDPIGIWGPNNIIVEGHGRQKVALELHMDSVPCIRLDELTDEQRRAYALAHNRTAEMSDWDKLRLESELADLELDFDMTQFGFDMLSAEEEEETQQEKYTKKTEIPQYEPKDTNYTVDQLYDVTKVNELIYAIDQSAASEEEKKFLRVAAYRHAVIEFDRVADYYATASKDVQALMEKSALVIIDFENAIANGYTTLRKALDDMMETDIYAD